MKKPLFNESKSVCLAALAVVSLLATPSLASRVAPVDQNEPAEAMAPETSLPRPASSPAALAEIANQVRASFASLETLMATKQYQAALTQSKALLDEVRVKSGIHPKASYREKIMLPSGSLANALKSANQNLQTLPIDTQDTIALTVSNHRAGFFLDILNLMKRVNLIYIRAFQMTLKETSGKLMARDIEKIRQDILDVHAVPLYLKDAKLSNYFLIFDFEVANSDQSYLFNRELMDYMLREGQELGITGEADFERLLAKHIEGVRNKFLGTLGQNLSAEQNTTSTFNNPNFLACYKIYTRTLHSSQAADVCMGQFKKFSFINNPEFDTCFDLYARTLHASQAANVCVDKLAGKAAR